jgi:hypothetical protein
MDKARMTYQKKTKVATPQVTRKRESETVQVVANEYCLLHYGTSYAGGIPYRLSLPNTELWIVPAVLSSPGYGIVGEVGMVAVDAVTKAVVAATSQDEARGAGRRLAQEKRHELSAAFRRARKA